ncbi:MAG: FAD-dependent oxidoreductase [Desulfobacterales bacterium]|nr:FAD-dependent oxidoreductase [Desulfobacterales bacterium]
MGKHLVLIGGGHAHMVTLAKLHAFIEKGHEVTVIGPSPFHYYSGMGPGMLGKFYTPDDIRFATRRVVEKQGGRFIQGKASSVDPAAKTVRLESGETIPYDTASFNAGSYVPPINITGSADNVFPVKPIEELMQAQERLLALFSEKETIVGVVGGGPSSAEVAGNAWRLARDKGAHGSKIIVFSGEKFMARFPEKIRSRVFKSFAGRGIEIREGDRVKEIRSGRLITEAGGEHDLDFIFLAPGVKPSPIFRESGLPMGPDGGLLVNKHLQCTEHPEIFGGGDCIYFKDQPLDKVGVYAVRENPVLCHNLMASLEGTDLMPFDPGGDYLLIFNLGDGTGVLHKRWLTLGGKAAFRIKDYIDRKFMREFQEREVS